MGSFLSSSRSFLSSLSSDHVGSRLCFATGPRHASEMQRRRVRSMRPSMRTEERVEVTTLPKPSILPTQRFYESYEWRQHRINFFLAGPLDGEPVLLVHGFGASINHWRKTIPALLDTGKLKVYAIDLLGFGGSDKPSPKSTTYSLDLWKELVIDFMNDAEPDKSWSMVGNSIGSLISMMATAELGKGRVRSCGFMNSAGGLTSFRMEELNLFQGFLLQLFNAVLFNKPVGSAIFRNVRKKETLLSVLKNVYMNHDAVDDDLLEIISAPAFDEGACEVFLAVFNADAGPKPKDLLPTIQWCPILVCWGEDDGLTPYTAGFHPGIRFPEYHAQMTVNVIPNCGHCPHDDRPEEINRLLVPFLLDSKQKSGAQTNVSRNT